MSRKNINKLRAENHSEFMEKGPGLRYTTNTWVEARDRVNGYVLVGGLGCMGVGTMWFKDSGAYSDYEGYADATERWCEDIKSPANGGSR